MKHKLKEREDFSYKRLNEIPGISTEHARGALYMFPRVDLGGVWSSDKEFVFDLIREEGVVLVHGSGFCNEFGHGHFRTILLPPLETLETAYDLLERFMRKRLA